MSGELALNTLAVQAPIIVILCLAVGSLFVALVKIFTSTIEDLRVRLTASQGEGVKAIGELRDAFKDNTRELASVREEQRITREELKEARAELRELRRGG